MEFDSVKFDKQKAIACFKLRQFFEVLLLLGFILWSSARAPELFKTAVTYAVDFSTYLFNHHVVFLIGNSIIVSLFLLCRRNNAAAFLPDDDGDLYSDYVKHSEAATAAAEAFDQRETTYDPPPPSTEGGSEGEKQNQQIVACKEEIVMEVSQCDDVAAAIEKAARQIKRFQRTQSEKLKREISAPAQEWSLRRSESQDRRKSVSCGERFDSGAIERLSSEEFRQKVDAFIDQNWRCRVRETNSLNV